MKRFSKILVAVLALALLVGVLALAISAEEPAPAVKGNFVVKGDGGVAASKGGAIEYKNVGDAGILCDRTYIEAVIKGDGSAIRSPYRDALKSLAFTLACNKSMETGMPVKIDDLLAGI